MFAGEGLPYVAATSEFPAKKEKDPRVLRVKARTDFV